MRKKPKHIIRTSTPAYRFASAKANETIARKKGIARAPSKLPTSLGELQAAFDDHVYNSPGNAGHDLAELFEKEKP